jgi:hypothetical protein
MYFSFPSHPTIASTQSNFTMHTKSISTSSIDNDSDKGNTRRLQVDDVMYVKQGALKRHFMFKLHWQL